MLGQLSAAGLCSEAKDGQILIDNNVRSATEAHADIEFSGELCLKSFTWSAQAFNVRSVKPISSTGQVRTHVIS
jgi:hypothetical protein